MISFTGKKYYIFSSVIIFPITVFFLITSFISNPENGFQKVINDLQAFLKGEIREVLYLHTNGNTFTPGDTIWFKAYNLRSGSLTPSILGSYLNVNISEYDGNQIFTGKYKLVYGSANGHIELPDSIENGKYILTAASNFTLNNFPEDIFSKEIEVRIPRKEEVAIKMSIADSVYSVQNLIIGELEVFGEKNSKLDQVKVILQLQQGQKILNKQVINTGKSGTVNFELQIPDKLGNEEVFLYAQIQQKGLSGDIYVNIPIETIPPVIRFFPESGQLIAGINSIIAFEAIDVFGNPFDFSGIIMNTEGQIVTEFSTKFLGMGSVNILPQKGEKLYLQIIKPKGYSQKYELPKPISQGYSLQIPENNSDEIILKVESNACSPNDSISVLVVLRNKIWFAKTAKFNELNNFSIPIKKMPMGVAQITVFDKNGIPLAERLVFLNQDKKINIIPRSLKEVYEKKEIVNIDLVAQNNLYEAIPGVFSVSVSPVFSENDMNWSDNIMVSTLLSGDLNDDIPAKGFYFSGKAGSKEAIDLLMLTHGWRKYSWENIQNLKITELKNNIGFSGNVSFKNGKPAKNADVSLMNIKTFQAITTKTNDDGSFSFNSKDYLSMMESGNLTLTATGSNGSKKVLITIDDFTQKEQFAKSDANSNYKKNVCIDLTDKNEFGIFNTTNPLMKNCYSNITNRNFWIDDVEVKANRIVATPQEVYEKQYNSYEKDEDQIHTNFGYNPQSGILQLLHEVAGSFKVADGGKILFRGSNSLYTENMQGALFVVNGLLAGFSCDDVSYLNSNDIKNIKVTKSSAAGLRYSAYANGGLIEITTKSDKIEKNKTVPNKMEQNVISISGYNLVKEFYSPVYKNEEEKNKNIDLRSTLYWEPNVVIYDSGKTSLEFFNSDIPGEYELRIEGLSTTGIPVYLVKRYTVM